VRTPSSSHQRLGSRPGDGFVTLQPHPEQASDLVLGRAGSVMVPRSVVVALSAITKVELLTRVPRGVRSNVGVSCFRPLPTANRTRSGSLSAPAATPFALREHQPHGSKQGAAAISQARQADHAEHALTTDEQNPNNEEHDAEGDSGKTEPAPTAAEIVPV
jgi:hypothetical protein